jgi:hypothetical protein
VWRAEAGRWFAVTLALLQQGLVGFVTGGGDNDDTGQAGVKSTILLDPGQIVLCWRQRVRNAAGVRNFGSGLFCWLFVLGWRLLWLGWGWTRLWDGSRRGRGMGRGAGGGGLLMACFSCSGWRTILWEREAGLAWMGISPPRWEHLRRWARLVQWIFSLRVTRSRVLGWRWNLIRTRQYVNGALAYSVCISGVMEFRQHWQRGVLCHLLL